MSETIRVLKFNKKNFQKKSLKILQIKILFLYLHREIKNLFEFLIDLNFYRKGYNKINSKIQAFFIMEEKKLNSVENVNVVVENSTKEKINKVNAKKAKAQSKANNILYKDILANLNKSTEGLLKTSFGVKKSDIYKEEIFSELSDKEKKIARKKFRNTILSLSESLTQEKDKTRLEKLKKAFLDFYKQVYKVNDFSLSSVCSENMKETNKEILKKALQIVKK